MPKTTSATWRLVGYTLLGVLAGATILFAWHQIDQYLISGPGFVLSHLDDDQESHLSVEGVKHASQDQINGLFRPDAGRSVYLIPLAERRRQMLALEWVRDAAVSRIWPDRIAVQVTERTPVAFVRIGNSAGNADLIDEDGVLLVLHDTAKFQLPVVTGISRKQAEDERKQRIKKLMRLESEIGRHMERISEVDVGDLDNLKISYALGDRAMVLYLGHSRYGIRLRRFLENREEIVKRLPRARILDLRLEDRIIAVPEKNTEVSNAG